MGKPSKSDYEFRRPEDTPVGVRYRKTASGFVATAPTGTLIMGLFMALVTFGLCYMLWKANKIETAPMSFFMVIGAVAVVFLVLTLYFTIGRIKVRLRADELTISKEVLGFGFRRRFRLSKIQRMRIRNRGGLRAFGLIGMLGTAEVREYVCEIETDREIRPFGSHLKGEHLYYMRYLVVQAARASTGIDI